MKKLMVAGFVALLLAGGAYFFWSAHTGSPEYSLKQLAAAAVAQDVERFERYVDIEEVVAGAVDDFFAWSMAEGAKSLEPGDPFRGLAEAFAVETINSLRGPLSSELIAMVRNRVRDGVMAEAGTNAASVSLPVVVASVRRVGEVRRDANQAMVELEVDHADLDSTLTVTATMTPAGSRWRISRLEGVAGHISNVYEIQGVRIASANAEIRPHLESMLEIEAAVMRFRSDGAFFFPKWYLNVEVPVRNLSDQAIQSSRFRLYHPQGPGYLMLRSPLTIEPGESRRIVSRVEYDSSNLLHRAFATAPRRMMVQVDRVVVGSEPETVHTLHEDWGSYRTN